MVAEASLLPNRPRREQDIGAERRNSALILSLNLSWGENR
jgi:hypothetical protein